MMVVQKSKQVHIIHLLDCAPSQQKDLQKQSELVWSLFHDTDC